MELVEFLLARVQDDEAEAQLDMDCDCRQWGVRLDRHGLRCAVRQLAECEAKRQIVQDHEYDEAAGSPVVRARELRLLAAVYADHPDYQQEWRP